RAGRKEWTGLAALSLPTLLLSIDTSVLYLALPSLSENLKASSVQQLWIMDIYGFMIAGFLITMGTLGDRIGYRRLLMTGAAAFSLASILAAFSHTAGLLIFARALMGIAGASIMPSTLAIIRNMFHHPHQRSTALSIWLSCFLVGMIIGPLIGGMILQRYSWGGVFLLGVPVMILLLVTGPLLLPEHRENIIRRLDWVGVAHSLAAILPLIYGITELTRSGWDGLSFVALITGLAFGVIFVLRQLRISDPLLDLRLFASKTFSATLLVMLITAIIMGGTAFFTTQYLQVVVGLSPLVAGLWLIPQAVGMIASSLLTPVIAKRIHPSYLLTAGLILTIIGFIGLAFIHPPALSSAPYNFALLIASSIATAAGVAPIVVLGTNLVISAAPPEKAGAAASMSETSNQLGIALGVALLGSLGTLVYRLHLSPRLPAGLSPNLHSAAIENITGAITTAARLPRPAAVDLLTNAQTAFTDGLHAAVIVGALGMTLLAIICITVLKKV
ncbi:MAG: MFS transporter, partial [Bacteroidetes bacterium]|nr:MFS transporter [Bacteroidota bacterium]